MAGTAQFILSNFVIPQIPSWLLCTPFEALKVHIQAGTIPSNHNSSLWSGLTYIYDTEGVSGLYRGSSFRVLHSFSRFLFVIPLELCFVALRPSLPQYVSMRFSFLIPMILTLLLNQAYTYPLIYLRKHLILNNVNWFTSMWLHLHSEGVHGLYYGVEASYIGLIPAIISFHFINRAIFPRATYEQMLEGVELISLSEDLEADLDEEIANREEEDEEEENEDEEEEEDDDWAPIEDENDEEDDWAPIEDEEEENDTIINAIDEYVNDEALLQVERTLARIQWKDWRVFCKIGSRAFATKVCSKLCMRTIRYPGDILSTVMQHERIGIKSAFHSVIRGQGYSGLFRGASIELLLVPLQIGVEMAFTILSTKYNWGGKFYSLFYGEKEENVIESTENRPIPGQN